MLIGFSYFFKLEISSFLAVTIKLTVSCDNYIVRGKSYEARFIPAKGLIRELSAWQTRRASRPMSRSLTK